jgi:hypothetical protein
MVTAAGEMEVEEVRVDTEDAEDDPDADDDEDEVIVEEAEEVDAELALDVLPVVLLFPALVVVVVAAELELVLSGILALISAKNSEIVTLGFMPKIASSVSRE